MGVHAESNEVIRDEAVEQRAEHVLWRERERVLRQNSVCVVTARAGTMAAMSVSRLVALATSRYASRGAARDAPIDDG